MSGYENEERRKPLLIYIGSALICLGLTVLGLFVFSPGVFGSAIQEGALALPTVPISIVLLGWVIFSLSLAPGKPVWVWVARFLALSVFLAACFDMVSDRLGLESAFTNSWYLIREPSRQFSLEIFDETSGWLIVCASALLLVSFKKSAWLGQLVGSGVLAYSMFNLLGVSLASPFAERLDEGRLSVWLSMGTLYSAIGICVLLLKPEDGFIGRFVQGTTARKMLFVIIIAMVTMPVLLAVVTAFSTRWLPESESATVGAVVTVLLIGLLALSAYSIRVLDREEQTAKNVGDALSESEYRMSLAQSFGGVGTWKYDVKEDKLLLSEEFCRIYGFEEWRREVDSVSAFNHPDDKDAVLKAVKSALNGTEKYEITHRIIRQDGEVRWVEKKGDVSRDKDGHAVSMYGIVTDVTDRVLSEKRLKEARERFERITAKAPGMVFQFAITKDGEMQFPYVSSGIETVFGISPESCMIVPGRLLSMVHPDDREGFYAAIEESHSSLNDYSWIGKAITAKGELKWIQINSRPTKQEDGSTVWDGMVTDVTESKFAQAALEATTEKFDFLLNESPTVVYDCQPEKPYEIRYVAPNFERLFGLGSSSIIGVPVFGTDNTHPDDFDLITAHEARFLELGESTAEFRIIVPDGSVKWVRDEIRRVTGDHGETVDVVGAWLEITEQKQAAIQLAESEARYERMAAQAPGLVFQFRLSKDNKPSFSYMSPGARALFEVEPGQIISTPTMLLRMLSKEDGKRFLKELLRSKRSHDDLLWSGQLKLQSGTTKWIQVSARPSSSNDGSTVWDGLVTDVTEITAAKLALTKYEEQYADVINSAYEAIITISAAGEVVGSNPGTERLFGYTNDELVGNNVTLLMPDEEAGKHGEYLKQYEHRSSSVVIGKRRELVGKRKDGTVFPIEITVSEFERDGETFFTGVARDITERKTIEDALKRSEERFRLMSESSPVGIGMRDAAGQYVYVNKTFEQILSYSLEEVSGDGWVKAIHEGDRDRVQSAWRDFLEDQHREPTESPIELEARWIRKDGGQIWIQVNSAPIIEDGELVNFVTTIQDITSRKETEMALVESEELLRAVSGATPMGIMLLTSNDEITIANDLAYKISDVTEEEMQSTGLNDGIHPDDRERAMAKWREFKEAQQRGEYRSHYDEHRRVRKDGTVVWVGVSASPVHTDNKFIGIVITVQDINNRKVIEAELEQTKDRMEFMLEESPAVVFSCSSKEPYEIQYVAANVEAILGYDPAQLVGLSLMDETLIREEDIETVEYMLADLQRTGSAMDEFQLRNSAGSFRWIRNDVRLIQHEDGATEQIVGTWLDITESKLAREAQRESEERFEVMSEAAPIGVFLSSADGTALYVNNAWRETTECGDRSDYNAIWSEFVHPDDREATQSKWSKFTKSGEDFDMEHRGVTPNGSEKWVHIKAVKYLREGDLEGFIGTVEDTTSRKVAEASLRESEERFRAMSESSPVGIAVADSDGGVTYSNKAFENICGLPVGRAMGSAWADSLHPEDSERVLQSWKDFRGTDGLFTSEHRLLYPDESMAWVFVIAAPMFDEGGGIKGYTMLLQDVTDRKKAEFASNQAHLDAVKANQAKSDFLSRMSHELRTPMNAIIGFAQLLDMDDLSQRQRESVDQILNGGRHLLSLINEVLDIARIESGRLGVSLEPVLVAPVISTALDMLRPLANENEVTLNWSSPLDGAVTLLADRQRMSQIMLNLVSNAIKYNRPGGHVDIIVDSPEDKFVRIVIKDTGIGISDEKLGRLFTPFDRLGADSTNVEGTGLGLALTSRLISAMGSQLDFSSQVGVGTQVTMLFPKAHEATPEIQVETAFEPLTSSDKVTHVLIIEDNETNISLMENIFDRQIGYELMVAMTGGLGLELAKKYVPDLIVLDVNLPDATGTSVLDAIKDDEELRSVPVIVLSADASQSQIDRFKKAGALAYLTKPVNIGELMSVIEQNIEAT